MNNEKSKLSSYLSIIIVQMAEEVIPCSNNWID